MGKESHVGAREKVVEKEFVMGCLEANFVVGGTSTVE